MVYFDVSPIYTRIALKVKPHPRLFRVIKMGGRREEGLNRGGSSEPSLGLNGGVRIASILGLFFVEKEFLGFLRGVRFREVSSSEAIISKK